MYNHSSVPKITLTLHRKKRRYGAEEVGKHSGRRKATGTGRGYQPPVG